MRILVLAVNYWPEVTGSAPLTTARCEYLASQGHEVTVCTGFPYYPEWKIYDGYRGRIIGRESHNKVTIQRSYLYVPSRVTTLSRIFQEASFTASSLLRAFASRRPDLIVAVSPPLGLGLSSWLLSRVWRIPHVFHVDDLQPDAAGDLGMLRSGRLIQVLERVARFAYRHASLVSTLTEGMRQRIIAKGIDADKVVVFPLWADESYFDIAPSQGQRFRDKFGLNGKFLVVHAGNMGVKQGLDVVLGAAALSPHNERMRYLLVGDGAMRPALQAEAARQNLANVDFIPVQAGEAYRDLLAAADVCLVIQQKSVADILFPSKVPPIFAAGRPVLASLSLGSEVARAIGEAGNGIIVEPEQAPPLAHAVQTAFSDSARLAEMGQRGKEYARSRWERGRVMRSMDDRLRQLATQPAFASKQARISLD